MREPLFPPRHRPLQADVSILGSLLGSVLREQGGERLFDTVESARLAAQERRAGDRGAGDRLAEILHDLPPADTEQVVRAFGAYFTLVNMAEQVHRIRRRRTYLANPEHPQLFHAVATDGPKPETKARVEDLLRAEGVVLNHRSKS